MASLVADYSSDSENSEDESRQEDTFNDIKVKEEVKEEQSALPSPPSNFFGTSDGVSDDDGDSDSNKTTSIKVKKESSTTTSSTASSRLPSLAEVNPGVIGSSVFVNSFDRAERAKNQILEKHVKLTEAAPQKPAGQPVCWKFKKGKCHMGKNCRFFHAVDNLSSTDDSSSNSNTTSSGNNNTHRSPYHPVAYMDARRRPLDVEPEDEDSYMSNMKKKKRVGINDRLVPPKKAFDSLMELRKKERPWTMPGAPS